VGCGEQDLTEADRPSPHPRPSVAGDCLDLPHTDGDPGILLGTDWSGEDHDYGDSAVVLACASPADKGTLTLEADGTGIDVTPRRARMAEAPDGIARFEVTVERGAAGSLRVRLDTPGLGGDLRGPEVVTDDDGWHLARATD
jgi:hypothetical protein